MLSSRVLSRVLLLVGVVGLGATSERRVVGAVSYTTPGEMVAESFDSLVAEPLNSTANWADDTTLAGWYVATSNGDTFDIYQVFDGNGASQNVLMSLGTVGDTDRSLGYQTGYSGASVSYGVRLVNDTGCVLHDFSVRYSGEQWRAVNSPADSVVFDYQRFSSGSGSLTEPSGWKAVESLRFDSPQYHSDSAENRGLDGNATANSATLGGTVTDLSWMPGEELWLRWTDLAQNANGSNVYQMMAIDDVQFTTSTPTVREVPICFDFGRSDTLVPDPTATPHTFGYYNDVTSRDTGLKVTDAVNVDNVSTGITLRIVDPFDGITASGTQGLVSDGAGFHENAQQDGFYVRTASGGSGVGALRLENLDPGLLYNIDLFGSRTTDASSDRYTVFTIGGEEHVLNTKGNTSDVATFWEVAPEYDANLDTYVIDIGVRLLTNSDTDLLQLLGIASTNTDHGYLSALRVTPVPEPGTILLLLAAIAGLAYWRRR